MSCAEECWIGQESGMIAVGWSVTEGKPGWTDISIEIKNNFEKDIKSSLARAVFTSKNGPLDEVGDMIVPELIAAGQTRTVKYSTDAEMHRKMIDAKEGTVQVRICTQSVRFEDGSTERFISPRSNQ